MTPLWFTFNFGRTQCPYCVNPQWNELKQQQQQRKKRCQCNKECDFHVTWAASSINYNSNWLKKFYLRLEIDSVSSIFFFASLFVVWIFFNSSPFNAMPNDRYSLASTFVSFDCDLGMRAFDTNLYSNIWND